MKHLKIAQNHVYAEKQYLVCGKVIST